MSGEAVSKSETTVLLCRVLPLRGNTRHDDD